MSVSDDGLKLGYDWAMQQVIQDHNDRAAQLSMGMAQGIPSTQAVTDSVIRAALKATQAGIDSLKDQKVTINIDSSGAGMFERFTDRARRVIVLSQEQARELNHNYIGTEHLLLGLIHEGEGVAAQSLCQTLDQYLIPAMLEDARSRVEKLVGKGEQAPSGHIPFTPRAKKIMEYALREALQLGHNYIGTEHLLLALLREGEGVGAKVLVELGTDLDSVRQVVFRFLGAKPPPPSLTAPKGGSEKAAAPSPDAVLLQSLRIYVDAINAHLKAAGY